MGVGPEIWQMHRVQSIAAVCVLAVSKQTVVGMLFSGGRVKNQLITPRRWDEENDALDCSNCLHGSRTGIERDEAHDR